MRTLSINLNLPQRVAYELGFARSDASQTAQHMLALFLYEHGKLSLGKASEFAGLGVWDFIDLAKINGVHIELQAHSNCLEANTLQNDLQTLRSIH